jgi:hypothetical protein
MINESRFMMNATSLVLDNLVRNKVIAGYVLNNLDEEGNIGKSKFRNTEQVVLEFNDGTKLQIDTFCSGSLEDTSLHFKII